MSQLVNCTHCGQEILVKKTNVCPKCGGKIKQAGFASNVFELAFKMIVGFVLLCFVGFLAIWFLTVSTDKKKPKLTKVQAEKQKQIEVKVKKYIEELSDAQTICNSVIPQKFPRLGSVSKNILIGHLDSKLGQHGYKGSGKKVRFGLPKGVHFRWTWTIDGSSKFIKCLVLANGKYQVTLESL
jgi:hypothetical protein